VPAADCDADYADREYLYNYLMQPALAGAVAACSQGVGHRRRIAMPCA
jgi:hypothetical protein